MLFSWSIYASQLSNQLNIEFSVVFIFLCSLFQISSLDQNWLQKGINIDQALLRLTKASPN